MERSALAAVAATSFRLGVIFFVLLCCACAQPVTPHDRLNGTWSGDGMTVTVDFRRGRYSGVALGQRFSEPLKLETESPGLVTFLAGESTIVAQFENDGSIMLTKQGPAGGIPVVLKRNGE